MRTLHAQPLGVYRGKRYYRVPVYVQLNLPEVFSHVTERHEVIASSAADAANYMRDIYSWRPATEIFAYGPKGGKVHRYIGWFTAIGTALATRRYPHPTLPGLTATLEQ